MKAPPPRTRRPLPGRAQWRLLCLTLGFGVLLSPPGAIAESLDLISSGRFFPCEMNRIELGDEKADWALIDGFDPDRDQTTSFAWIDGRARTALVLDPGHARTLRVHARSGTRGLALEVRVNGVDLGARKPRRRWSKLEWEIPIDLIRAGPTSIELEIRDVKQGTSGESGQGLHSARRRVAIAAIVARPQRRCSMDATDGIAAAAEDGLSMRAGSFLTVPLTRASYPELRLDFTARFPRTSLGLFCLASEHTKEIARLTAGRSSKAVHFQHVPEECGQETTLVLRAGSSEPRGIGRSDRIHLLAAEASGSSAGAWKSLFRLQEAGLVILLSTLILVSTLAGARIPLRRCAPWLDAAAIVLFALVVRLLFLHLYPHAGRSGDEWEYLSRSKVLAFDWSRFLTDTWWHGWQSWSRPPGYYLFLAAVRTVLGPNKIALSIFQMGLSALAAGATYLIAYPLFGRGAALVSGSLFALYVGSFATATRVLTEPLFMSLLLPALAALTWTWKRPSWRLAAVAGLLFGLATLVRSAPLHFVLLAVPLLLAVHGVRKGLKLAIPLVTCTLLVTVPWAVRNSLVSGHRMGLETLSTSNLIQSAPDDRFVEISDLDVETEEGYAEFYSRLKVANEDGRLANRKGEILRTVLVKKLTDPFGALSFFGRNLAEFFGLVPESYLRWILFEENSLRVTFWTDMMNAQYLLILVTGTIGALWTIRQRAAWPLLTWFLFNTVIINFLFHPAVRYRFSLLPVLMVFSGFVIARALTGLRDWRRRAGA